MLSEISRAIDAFNDKEGEITSMLIYPLLVIVIYEVFMRYVFNAPTSWGFEATTFLYGVHYMFGLAYTDVHDGHVKVDIFTSIMSKRNQAIIGIITNCVIFLPVFTCMAIWAVKFAASSAMTFERNSTSWAPAIWPFKIIMALTCIFLLAQGVSNLFKHIRALSE